MRDRRSIKIFSSLAALVWSLAAVGAQEFAPIDLARFYTLAFSNAAPESVRFPIGDQTFHQVPFHVGGRIEITGMDAARHGSFQPTEVAGIPVNRQAKRLHLLHGALHGSRAGIPLANIILRYKNGDAVVLRLSFGVHAGNCVEEVEADTATLGDPNSLIAWQRVTKSTVARLFHTPLDNPYPHEEIASLDFVSLFGRATPVLFAVTLQDGERAAPLAPLPDTRVVQRATEFVDATYRRILTVRALAAAAGTPLSNALVTATVVDDEKTFSFGQYRVNAAGTVSIPYPPQHAAALSIRASEPGYAADTATFSALGGKTWTDKMDVRLHRGVPLRGVVVDTSGAPVSNAVVIPYELNQKTSNEFTRADLDLATTAADGKWEVSVPTQLLAQLSFEATHPDYHNAHEKLPLSALRDGTAKIELRPHLLIAGRVLSSRGEPLVRAFVTLIETNDDRVTHTTDEAGRFRFIIREARNTPSKLIVLARDHAPALQPVTSTAASSIEVKLTEGAPFSMQLTDARGKPNPDVSVSLYRWQNQLSAFKWSTKTDAEGRFRWDHAPEGQIMFRFEKGGSSHYYSTALPAKTALTFSLRGQTRLGGRVVDVKTKQPVDQLRVRGVFNKNGSTSSYSSTGRRGSFNMIFSGQNAAEYTDFTLTIDAAGYETFSTNMPANFESSTNVYEVKKARMLEGIVVAPDGSPAADSELVLLEPNQSAYMDEPAKFRRNSSFDVITADERGRFELPYKTNADVVLALHPQHGFVQMAAADFRKTNRIALQPWGRIQGLLRVGEKVEPEHFVAVHTHFISDGTERRSGATLYLYYKIKPQPDGRFLIDAVPPGERMVQLRYMQSGRESGEMRLSHNVPVTVAPGQTHEVTIGGDGRTVTGKVRIVGATDVRIDGWRGTFALRSQPGPMPSEIPPPLIIPPSATPTERQRLLQAHQEKIREAARNRTRASRFQSRTYFLLFDDDNTFTIPNVPAGRYSLQLMPYDPRLPTSTSRTLGNVTQMITVPDGTTLFDAGTFEIRVRE